MGWVRRESSSFLPTPPSLGMERRRGVQRALTQKAHLGHVCESFVYIHPVRPQGFLLIGTHLPHGQGTEGWSRGECGQDSDFLALPAHTHVTVAGVVQPMMGFHRQRGFCKCPVMLREGVRGVEKWPSPAWRWERSDWGGLRSGREEADSFPRSDCRYREVKQEMGIT